MSDFVAIDLETANACRSSICQIGITEVVKGEIQASKSWLVRPMNNYYDSFNIEIHGITPEDTKNSPSFPEVWEEVAPYLEGKLVVAHNTSFDMYALRDAFDLYNMSYPTFDYFCTLRIARHIIKGCYSYSLNIILNHLGIEFREHHKADSDSYGCAKLLLRCLEIDDSTLGDLEDKYLFHRGKFAPNTFIAHLAKKKSYKGTSSNVSKGSINILDELEEHPDLIDEGNYFYGKTVCFTGKCQYGIRKELLQKIKDIGGIPTDSVTKSTEVLVVGQQDYRVVGDDGLSGKQKKALKLLGEGQNIEILSEAEFLCRI